MQGSCSFRNFSLPCVKDGDTIKGYSLDDKANAFDKVFPSSFILIEATSNTIKEDFPFRGVCILLTNDVVNATKDFTPLLFGRVKEKKLYVFSTFVFHGVGITKSMEADNLALLEAIRSLVSISIKGGDIYSSPGVSISDDKTHNG